MGIGALAILLILLGLLILGGIEKLWISWDRRDAARRSAEPRYWRGPR